DGPSRLFVRPGPRLPGRDCSLLGQPSPSLYLSLRETFLLPCPWCFASLTVSSHSMRLPSTRLQSVQVDADCDSTPRILPVAQMAAVPRVVNIHIVVV